MPAPRSASSSALSRPEADPCSPPALPAYRPAQIVTIYQFRHLSHSRDRRIEPCPPRGRVHNLSSLLPRCSCSPAARPIPRPPPRPSVRSGCSASRSRTRTAARDFVGVVRARYENDLGFRVAGKIVTRVVNVGDRVHAGDVGGATRSAGPEAAGRKRRGRARGGDLESRRRRLRISSVTPRCAGAAMRRSRTSSARRRPTTKPKGGSSVPGAPSTWRAINTAMPTSRRMPTASSPRRWPSPVRSWPSARPWRGLPIRARRKPWSLCPRLGSPRPASRARSCACGPIAIVPSMRSCANSRRRPTTRRAPTRRASPSRRRTTPSRSA